MRYFIVANEEAGEVGWTYIHDERKDYHDEEIIDVWNMLLPTSEPEIFRYEDLCEITEEEYNSVYLAEDPDEMNEATDDLLEKYGIV